MLPISVSVGCLGCRCVVLNPASEGLDGKTVLCQCLFGNLIYELVGRTQEDDLLAILASPPIRQQQPNKGLAAARWQLKRYVAGVESLGRIVT